MKPTVTAVREALVATLRGDPELVGLLGDAQRVRHRMTRRQVALPAVTYYDTVTRPDPRMPAIEVRIQVDVWGATLDLVEEAAARVARLLDTYQALDSGSTPFKVTTGELNMTATRLETERDDVASEAPDVFRKTLTIRVTGWDLT